MYKPLLLLSLLLAMPLFGCSSDSAPPFVPGDPAPPPPPPPLAADDVSGNWFMRIANNAVNCDLGEIIDAQALFITQDANDVSILNSTGNTLTGTINGDLLELTGEVDERGGTTTFDSVSITFSADTGAGNATWTWTDGTDSCNGTMDITLAKDWGVADGVKNSRPGIADPIVFTDSVAFVAGTISKLTDKDYFSFELDADAIVQIELSHFDLQTTNLDLVLLDSGRNQIAVSESVDGFEKIEVPLLKSRIYFIGVLPTSVDAIGTYNLSIDVN